MSLAHPKLALVIAFKSGRFAVLFVSSATARFYSSFYINKHWITLSHFQNCSNSTTDLKIHNKQEMHTKGLQIYIYIYINNMAKQFSFEREKEEFDSQNFTFDLDALEDFLSSSTTAFLHLFSSSCKAVGRSMWTTAYTHNWPNSMCRCYEK